MDGFHKNDRTPSSATPNGRTSSKKRVKGKERPPYPSKVDASRLGVGCSALFAGFFVVEEEIERSDQITVRFGIDHQHFNS
jgi:hypothetical protein